MPETITTPGLVPVTILNQAEYFGSLQRDIRAASASDNVSMVVMGLEPREPDASAVLGELEGAAERKASVAFGMDAYTCMVTDGETYVPGPMFLPLPFGQQIFRERREAFDRLARQTHVQAGILNTPSRIFSNPFAGRSHIKLAAVKDVVYVAGPNLYALHGRDDMVLRLTDSRFSESIHGLIRNLISTGSTREALSEDQRVPIDPQTDLLIDAGRPSESLIMDTALETIDRAKQWIVVSSQFFPTPGIARGLRRALQQGLEVHIVRNGIGQEKSLKRAWQAGSLAVNRIWLPDRLFADRVAPGMPSSHVALLATETDTIKGSHNFHAGGVTWGTAEAVLHRRNDPGLATAVAQQLFRQTGLVRNLS